MAILAAIFYKLLYMSLTGLAVGAVILLIRKFADRRFSPGWKYVLWALMLLALLIPWRPQSQTAALQSAEPLQTTSFQADYQQARRDYQAAAQAPDPTPVQRQEIVQDKAKADSLHLKTLIFDDLIPGIWVAGAVGIGLFFLISGRRLGRKIKKSASPQDTVRYEEALARCQAELGMRRKVELAVQGYVRTPALFGLFRPKIVLPESAADLSDQHLDYILLHELSHLKRGDNAVNTLLLILQPVYWFNPFLWLLWKRVREDMELANDAAVLRGRDDEERRQYSLSLVEALAGAKKSALAPRLLGMVDSEKNMARRINMIKLGTFFKRRRAVIAVAAVAVIAVVSILFLTVGGGGKVPFHYPYSNQSVSVYFGQENLANMGFKDDGLSGITNINFTFSAVGNALENATFLYTRGVSPHQTGYYVSYNLSPQDKADTVYVKYEPAHPNIPEAWRTKASEILAALRAVSLDRVRECFPGYDSYEFWFRDAVHDGIGGNGTENQYYSETNYIIDPSAPSQSAIPAAYGGEQLKKGDYAVFMLSGINASDPANIHSGVYIYLSLPYVTGTSQSVTGSSTTETATAPTASIAGNAPLPWFLGNSPSNKAFKSVLQSGVVYTSISGNGSFSSIDNKYNIVEQVYIDPSGQWGKSKDSVTPILKFAVIDIDNDGTPEVILWISRAGYDHLEDGYNDGVEILDYQNEAIFGYYFGARECMGIKSDGTFRYSGGANDWGYATFTLGQGAYTMNRFTYCETSFSTDATDPPHGVYTVNQKTATADEFNVAAANQDNKPDVTWYLFTADNIKALFNNNGLPYIDKIPQTEPTTTAATTM